MSVTLDVSQLDTLEEKFDVFPNIPYISVTLDVSQPERSSSKSDTPENKLDMSVTPDVFQLEIGPQESSVFDEFEIHFSTNKNKVSLSMVSQAEVVFGSSDSKHLGQATTSFRILQLQSRYTFSVEQKSN